MSVKKGVMLQGFEWYLPNDAQHWNRLLSQTGYLKSIGITSVWLPPAYKGASGISDVGYGVYDMYDLGEFDQKGTIPTKYGTKDEYIRLIAEFENNGIDVYADVVLNHKMGADECESVTAKEVAAANRNFLSSDNETIGSWDIFTFPGRKGKYSDFVWNHRHFDGIDWDQSKVRNGIFLFKDKQWDEDCDIENVNYDYLMGADVDFSNHEAVVEITRWGKWYLDMTHVSGFRLDAVKHINAGFFCKWLKDMREYKGSELFAVGEYWSPYADRIMAYLEKVNYCMSVFDVPLHFNFFKASTSDGNFNMAEILKGTIVERARFNAVTFVDNHDTQPGQALETYVAPWFRPLAYAIILLRSQGYPCVFYGDLYGIPHDGIKDMSDIISLFLKIRRQAVGFESNDYFDDFDAVGWTYGGEKPLAVLMTDKIRGSKKMYVDKALAGKTLVRLYGREFGNSQVVIDNEGFGNFAVEGGSVAVWGFSDYI